MRPVGVLGLEFPLAMPNFDVLLGVERPDLAALDVVVPILRESGMRDGASSENIQQENQLQIL